MKICNKSPCFLINIAEYLPDLPALRRYDPVWLVHIAGPQAESKVLLPLGRSVYLAAEDVSVDIRVAVHQIIGISVSRSLDVLDISSRRIYAGKALFCKDDIPYLACRRL